MCRNFLVTQQKKRKKKKRKKSFQMFHFSQNYNEELYKYLCENDQSYSSDNDNVFTRSDTQSISSSIMQRWSHKNLSSILISPKLF